MGYPDHYLLAFGGHAGDVLEEWVCGIRLCEYGTGVFGDVDEDSYLTTVAAPALTTWFGSVGASIYSGAKLLWAKFNKIDSQGHYLEATATHEHSFGAGVSGGNSAPLHPLQVCLVLSWRTNAADRGLASHGRIYQPRPAMTVDAAGDIAGALRVAAATAAATLLNTLDITVGSGFLRPSIVSPGRNWPAEDNPGARNQIDTVIVDSALDIQRRRAKSQSREISSAPVAY